MLSKQEAPATALGSKGSKTDAEDKGSNGKLRERDIMEPPVKKSKTRLNKPSKPENKFDIREETKFRDKKLKIDTGTGTFKRKRPSSLSGNHSLSKERRMLPPPSPSSKSLESTPQIHRQRASSASPVEETKGVVKESVAVDSSSNDILKQPSERLSPRSHRALERIRARASRNDDSEVPEPEKKEDNLKEEKATNNINVKADSSEIEPDKSPDLPKKKEPERSPVEATVEAPQPETKLEEKELEPKIENKNITSDTATDILEKSSNEGSKKEQVIDKSAIHEQPKKEITSEIKEKAPIEESVLAEENNKDNSSLDKVDEPAMKKRKRRNDEEKSDESAKAKQTSAATRTETSLQSRPPKRSASKNCPGSREDEDEKNPSGNAEEQNKKIDTSTRQVDKASRSRRNAQASSPVDKIIDWVQCERCQKWRALPPSLSSKSLADHWYCEMNTWDPNTAKCSAPQQEQKEKKSKSNKVEDKGDKSPHGSDSSGGKSSKKKNAARNRPSSRNRGKSQHGNRPRINSQMSSAMNTNKASEQQENKWVMCETCQQWRKLPSHVDTSTLPDKWYCSMNKWDPLRQSCSAPEETDDSKLVQTTVVASSSSFVTLPEGASLYGNNVWPVIRGNKAPPANYRELIVSHYRHFKQWEVATSKVINERYRDSSLYIPQDISRMKSSKHGKRSASKSHKHVSSSQRKVMNKGISADAVKQKSLFHRLMLEKPEIKRESHCVEGGNESANVWKREPERVVSALLKWSKPWKI